MTSHKWFTPWLLVAPALVWLVVFSLWPFISTVGLSFTSARPLDPGEFVGFDNYAHIFEDERVGYALITSFTYTIVCIPLLTFLPLFLALLVEKHLPFITFFRTTFYFPVVASVVVVGLIFSWIFDSKGVINQTLEALGITDRPITFLVDRWWLIGVAIILTVWKGLGYYMVVYLAALGSVNRELHEAAALDGAGAWRRFWSVTVPGVRPAMLLVMALIATAAMRSFGELYQLSNGTGGPGGQSQTVVMLIRNVGSGLTGNVGYASALSVMLFLLTIVPLGAVAWMNREKKGDVA